MKMLAYLFLAISTIGTAVIAQDKPMVGGAAILPTMGIVSNAINSGDHTALVSAFEATKTTSGHHRPLVLFSFPLRRGGCGCGHSAAIQACS